MDDGVLFVHDCIVMPTVLRPNMPDLVHESHLGVGKMKAHAKVVLFWTGMLSNIDEIASVQYMSTVLPTKCERASHPPSCV